MHCRLELGWVTVCALPEIYLRLTSHRSTQPGHFYAGGRNEYWPKDGDALWLGVKTCMACVWWQVKLCDPLYNTCHQVNSAFHPLEVDK